MLVVQCDFDDTVSVGNVSAAIKQEFGPAELVAMEREYHSGLYSVEESNIRQFGLVTASEEHIAEFVVSAVKVRDGFTGFVNYCRREGLKLVIVSSGLDLYIAPTLARLGLSDLEFYSARTRSTGKGIEVTYTDPWGDPITRGFKDAHVRSLKKKGATVIYVGDGYSDFGPAEQADFVIARSQLEAHRRRHLHPFFPFETFNDVERHVEEIRRIVARRSRSPRDGPGA